MITDMPIKERIANDFGYHKATAETGPMHDAVRTHFKELAYWLIDNTPASREQSLMLTELQQAQMWANAAIACNLSPLES